MQLTEHKQLKQMTRNCNVNNHIAEHHLQMKHQSDWESATCIHVRYSTDHYQRPGGTQWRFPLYVAWKHFLGYPD